MTVSVKDLKELDPNRFEILIARLLETSGLSNVVSIGGVGDEGIDLRAEWIEDLPTGDKRTTIWAIQCKRYSASISQRDIQTILNSALEPPFEIFKNPPDFFLLATSSKLSPAALRLMERANSQRGKYSCRFILWDGERIAQKVSENQRVLEQFSELKNYPPTAVRTPAARLTVLTDMSDDRVALFFVCEPQELGPVVLSGKTEIPLGDFQSLTQKCNELTNQVVISTFTAEKDRLLKETGKIINGLIPQSIREFLSKAGDIYLRLESNTHLIPFEIAYDQSNDTFLGATAKIGRIQISSTPPQQSHVPQPSILLVGAVESMAADPHLPRLPSVTHELEKLSSLLAARGFRVETISGYAATRETFHQALRSKDYQIVHFSGHGITDPKGKGGLLLADGIVSYEEITSVRVNGSLVFLNACSSGSALNNISNKFFLNGAQALIGFVGWVTDEGGEIIAMKFYEKLSQGETLGVAMHDAREFQRTSKPNDSSWVSFVLFGDPTITMKA